VHFRPAARDINVRRSTLT